MKKRGERLFNGISGEFSLQPTFIRHSFSDGGTNIHPPTCPLCSSAVGNLSAVGLDN